MLLCGSCHSTHENEHMKTMIRFKPIQWMERMPEGLRSTAPCSHCAKDAKARWECEACQEGLCKRCVSDFDRRLAFFKEHHESSPNHRHFKAIYPPEWRVNERVRDPAARYAHSTSADISSVGPRSMSLSTRRGGHLAALRSLPLHVLAQFVFLLVQRLHGRIWQ